MKLKAKPYEKNGISNMLGAISKLNTKTFFSVHDQEAKRIIFVVQIIA